MESKRVKKVWIDGNTLVKKDGERMADYELSGNGYLAKLTEFIKKRDQAIASQDTSKYVPKTVRKQKESQAEAEPML